MHDRIQQFRIACRPFVTRALRGPRRRRFVSASALLALFVLLVGTWVGLSAGEAARELRVELDMEQNRWERERTEFVIFADSPLDRELMLEHDTKGSFAGPLRDRAEQAWMMLDTVAGPSVVPPQRYAALQQQARALRDARRDLAPNDWQERRHHTHFDWDDPRELKQLQTVVDAKLVPKVVLYRSPLTVPDTVRLVGMFAGGLLLLLLTIAAPLWVAARLAQELHENTLQPLTGTALTARQLVAGLVAGPMAPIVIIAAPLAILTLASATVAGRLMPTVGFMVDALAMGAMLVGLSMLIALAVGRRRAPGLVGIGLLCVLGLAALAGLGAGLNLDRHSLGLVTIIPSAGPVHLLTEALNPVAHLDLADARALDLRLVLSTFGAGVLTFVSWRAIERRVAGTHHQGSISRIEGFVAALTLSVLAASAMPSHAHFGEVFFIATAVMLVPLQLVLAGRVPGGDVPPNLRQVPVLRLVTEHLAWVGMTVVVALALSQGPREFGPGVIVGVLHLMWTVVVVSLITIRGTALPTSIPAKIWLVVCLGFSLIEYGTAAVWCMDKPDAELLFPLATASPVLGLLHVGLFLWVPISLLRGLTANRPSLDLTAEAESEAAGTDG